MSPYKKWQRAYAFLNDEQLIDPVRVISACASGDSIFTDRRRLFDIFYAAISSRAFEDHKPEMIEDYIYTWERAITIIECSHRLHELMKENQVHYSYSGDVDPK